MSYYDNQTSDVIREVRERRLKKRRLKRIYKSAILASAAVLTGVAICVLVTCLSPDTPEVKEPVANAEPSTPVVQEPPPEIIEVEEPTELLYSPIPTAETIHLGAEVQSEYALLIEAESGTVIAEKSGKSRINPASMTKVLTLLVAAEQITDHDGTFTMTREIADYCYINECSVVGYVVGEQIPIRELFYGCILCSGADACLALAELACGSHEAFVERMNEKIEELGRSETAHFTNCVGIYDENHYCTTEDMAVFMKAAFADDFCRTVLSSRTYTSEPTAEHLEGQVLSNWFIRKIEDKDTGNLKVISGKTGYVAESGNCAVSYGENSDGDGFICVTGKGSGSWPVIYDHVALYKQYCQGSSAP